MDIFNAIVDVDLDAERPANNIQEWLAYMMSRAFGPGRQGRKNRAEDALKALTPVATLDQVPDPVCPICYDSYTDPVEYKQMQQLANAAALEAECQRQAQVEDMISRDDDAHEFHRRLELEPWRLRIQYNDPLMFFPVDESGFNYLRFPQTLLLTHEKATTEDMFPGYQLQESPIPELDEDAHIPMRIHGCDHIFGRLCLVEWFKTNALCPLCRKEAEIACQRCDNHRVDRIERGGRFAFGNEHEERERLMEVTDVFAPQRRSFTGQVTPLADFFTRQHWATPLDVDYRPEVADPDLVMAQQYRGGDQTVSFFSINS